MESKFKINIGTQLGNEDRKHNCARLSPFGVTINPNISTTPDTPRHLEVQNKLMECCNELFGTEDAFKQNIVFLVPGDEWNDETIADMENNVTVEYGRKKWHIQAAFHITHCSKIKLDKAHMVDHVARKFNKPSSTVHCHIETKYKAQSPDEAAIAKARAYPLKNRANLINPH